MSAIHPAAVEVLYGDYPLNGTFDEMRQPDRPLRSHFRALAETLARLPQNGLERCKQSAALSFLNQGITFTVYGRQEGTERIFPKDLLPRHRHIRAAVCRDYADVPPTHGAFRGQTGSEIYVAVHVEPSEQPPALDRKLPIPNHWSVLVERAQRTPELRTSPVDLQQIQQQQ